MYFTEIMSGYWTLLICLVGVNAYFINDTIITGETNHEQDLRWQFVMSDITMCSQNGQLMNKILKMRDIFQCISQKTSHCRMNQVRIFVKDNYKVRSTYCGVFSMRGRINSQNIQIIAIQTYVNHIFNLEFNTFNFEWRRNECEKHNVIIRPSVHNSSSLFCGKRLPWTMILHDTKAFVYLRVEKYRSYQLAMFYSSYKPEWFGRVSHIYRLYKTSTSFWHLPLSLNYQNMEIIIYSAHLLVDPWQKIRISLTWRHLSDSNTTVVIHDGPGHLSPHLGKFGPKSRDGIYKVNTAAFSAFLQIKMSITNKIHMTIAAFTESTRRQPCVKRNQNIRLSSSNQKNTVCLVVFTINNRSIKDYGLILFLRIYIQTFIFYGPQIVVDEGNHNCHYGGIYIANLNDNGEEMIPICDSRDGFMLNSKLRRMKVLVVFYASYSAGKFKSTFYEGTCLPTYLDLIVYPNYNTFQSAVMDDSHYCQLYVCAPREIDTQGQCVVNIINQVHKAFGTVETVVTMVDTLFSCVPEYYPDALGRTLHFEVTISNTWPLGKPDFITTNEIVPVDGLFQRVFPYFYNGSFILPGLCLENRQKQMMILIKQSVCFVTAAGHHRIISVAYIPALSQSCYQKIQKIQHYRENASFLIHKEGIDIHEGGILYTNYEGPCSAICRQYQIVVLVLKRREDRVYEYRANVGEKISPGFTHNGFRVTVIPPSLLCECDIGVMMNHFASSFSKNYKREPKKFWTTSFGDLYQKQ